VFDAKLAILEKPVVKNATGMRARLALAGLSQGRQSMREAVPRLASIARSDAADSALRRRAWVDPARAYLWSAESEEGRHGAEALTAVRGARTSGARTEGGHLLASRGAKANRAARSRQGSDEVIDTALARRAGDEFAGLPKEER